MNDYKVGYGHRRQRFLGEVVDHGQDAEAPPAGELVGHEVERPALVGTLRQRQRRPNANRPPTAPPAPHLQLLLAVEPAEALVVHPHPLALQQPLQAPIAKPPPLGRQGTQALSNRRVVRPGRSIPEAGAIHPQKPAGAPLAQAVRRHRVLHRPSPCRRLQKFPEAMSFKAALSSIASASSFFSLRFSSSS